MKNSGRPSKAVLVIVMTMVLTSCFDHESVQPADAHDGRRVLAMRWSGQQTPVWCWAAVSEMCLNYYQHPTSQCSILSSWYCADCCSNPSYCQTTGTLQQIQTNLSYFGHLGSSIVGKISFEEIEEEITNNRPVILVYQSYQSGHVVICEGYDRTSHALYIYDPLSYNSSEPNGAWVVPYDNTTIYGGADVWTNTIIGIQP